MNCDTAKAQVAPPPVKVAVTVPVPVGLAPLAVRPAAVAVVDALALLLPADGSVVPLVTVAVFVIVPDVLAETWTTREIVADAPEASVAAVQLTVPAAPTAGVVHVNAGPAIWVDETKVVPAGSRSESVTVAAALGPALATVIVYARLVPGVTVAGAVFVTETSAETLTVVVAVAELLPGVGSGVVLDVVAVLDSVPVAPVGTLTTSEKVALAPEAIEAMVQLTVPPAPTAGVVQLNAGPAVCVEETNVVPAGSASESVTPVTLGPALATVMV
jgi:hypothetical protein